MTPLLPLLSTLGLLLATLLVTVYVEAQRYRIRLLERRIAAARAEWEYIKTAPQKEHEEEILVTWAYASKLRSDALKPHIIAARAAWKKYPDSRVSIGGYWSGTTEEALAAWVSEWDYQSLGTDQHLRTTITRRVPQLDQEE